MGKGLIVLLLNFLLIQCVYGFEGSVHTCIHASNKVRKTGESFDTDELCMGCDPTLATCPVGCQKWVSKLWKNCGNVCLPDGYFFDPSQTVSGCFEDAENNKELFIQANRCGCSAASRTDVHSVLVLVFMTMISLYLLFLQ